MGHRYAASHSRMTQRLEVLGWWFNPHAPTVLPLPQRLVGGLDDHARAAVLAHLRAGRTLVTWPAASFCRFDCGIGELGTQDLTDGTFVWPDGLAHYVERHDVRLPEHFVAHAQSRRGLVGPGRLPKAGFGLYDKEPWLRWALAQRACPDLAGFELPDAATQERIADELGEVPFAAIRLCRGNTREVVLERDDGALELRQLRVGGAPPQQFRSWLDWPVAGTTTTPPVAPPLAKLREKPRPGVTLAEFLARRRPDGPPE